MKGIYKVEKDKVEDFINSQVIRNIVIFSLIILIIVVYVLFDSDIKTALIIGIILISVISFAVLISVIIAKKTRNIYDNFELEILDDKLIRKGTGFYKIELKYEEIGRVFMTSKFLIVLKKGIGNNMKYYARNVIRIDAFDIVVIPDILSNFEKVKSYIESKIL